LRLTIAAGREQASKLIKDGLTQRQAARVCRRQTACRFADLDEVVARDIAEHAAEILLLLRLALISAPFSTAGHLKQAHWAHFGKRLAVLVLLPLAPLARRLHVQPRGPIGQVEVLREP
jgi:hypothetical protein